MKRLFILFAALTAMTLSLRAVDFFAINDGDTIYYNITSAENKTVEVTANIENEIYYSDSVNVPTSVSHDNVTYSVTRIGNFAFAACTSLRAVTIPNSITEIGEMAFGLCCGLETITIPNSTTKIEKEAFYNCLSLNDITIPNSVKEIGNTTFLGCSTLVSITIPSSVTKIGGYTFAECTSLRSITIPNSVTEIEYYAFVECTSLKSIIIPNAVTHIRGRAFNDCSNLTSITFGTSVSYIGYSLLEGCDSITSVYVKASTPPKIEDALFDDAVMDKTTPIYVPDASVEKYKNAEVWKDMNILGENGTTPVENIQENEINFTLDGNTISLDEEQMVQVYSVSGICVYSGRATTVEMAQAGVYVVVTATSQTKIVVN